MASLSPRSRLLLALLVAVLALIVRAWWVRVASPDGILPTGPDADDWASDARAWTMGQPEAFQANRMPLVPALTGLLARWTGTSTVPWLVGLSWLNSSFTAALAAHLCQRWTGALPALAVGAWLALAPHQAALGVSVSAYTTAGLAFLGLAAALLEGHAAWALLTGLVLAGTLHQGIWSGALLLPVAWLAGRGSRPVIFASIGLIGGVGLGHALHPGLYSPLTWLPREAWRYLSGNIAEETGRLGTGYLPTFTEWCTLSLDLHPAVLAVAGLIAVIGLGLRLRRARTRPGALALLWAVAPACVLVATLASAHHLAHLAPLATIAVAAGVSALPMRGLRWTLGGGLILALLGGPALRDVAGGGGPGTSQSLASPSRARLGVQAAEAQRQQATARALVAVIDLPAAVLVYPQRGGLLGEELVSAAWALPPTVHLTRGGTPSPAAEAHSLGLDARFAHVYWVGPLTEDAHALVEPAHWPRALGVHRLAP